MMRILYVTTIAEFVRAFLLPYADHYRKLGARVDVATNGAATKGVPAHCDAAYDLPWSRSVWAIPRVLWAGARLRRIVKRNRYDIVHVHTPIAAFCTRAVLAGLREPRPVVIYTAHGFHFYSGARGLASKLWRCLETGAARWTDYLVAINEEDARYAESHLLPKERVVRMPGVGVDTAGLRPECVDGQRVREFRSSLGLAPDDKLFVMVAEFTPGKRHRDAVRALAQTAGHYHLALAGEGPLSAKTVNLGRQLGVAERVHFLGFRNDVPVCMRAGCGLLLPSDREGLSRSILEAFCLGVPVIATDVRGNRDLVRDNGTLVPLGDTSALAAAMERVAEGGDEIAALTAKASEFVRQFDIEVVLRMHDELYARAMREKRAADH